MKIKVIEEGLERVKKLTEEGKEAEITDEDKALVAPSESEKTTLAEKRKDWETRRNEFLKVLPKVGFTIGPDSSGVLQLSKKVEALFVETFEEEVVDEKA